MSRIAWLPRVLALALIVALAGLAVYFELFFGTRISVEASCPKEAVETTEASIAPEAGGITDAKPDDGLVGYWKFEEVSNCARDSSGNGNDGVLVNSTVRSARFGKAVKLKGSKDSHVSIPASPSLDGFSDQITVCAWVFPQRPPKGFKVVVSRQIGTLRHPDQFYLGFGEINRETHYKWHLGTIDNGTENDRAIYTGNPAFNRWIHMAGVYDGKTMRLYVDGVEIGSETQTGQVRVDDNPVTIGAEENGARPYVVDGEFDGLIDEVRIYNRALSADEIKKIYELPSH